MNLPNKVYDILKWVAIAFLPALGAMYFALGSLLGWPDVDKVCGAIAIVGSFIAGLLGIGTKNYKGDGTININTTGETKDVYSFDFVTPLEDLPLKSTVLFKVNATPASPSQE